VAKALRISGLIMRRRPSSVSPGNLRIHKCTPAATSERVTPDGSRTQTAALPSADVRIQPRSADRHRPSENGELARWLPQTPNARSARTASCCTSGIDGRTHGLRDPNDMSKAALRAVADLEREIGVTVFTGSSA
jgi:hypothetical protein